MLLDEKYRFVEECIQNNLYSSDLLVSLFVSSLNSFRHDTLLRPFPPGYLIDHGINPKEKDFERLKSDISSLTSLKKVSAKNVKIKENILSFFVWLFDIKKFKLNLCDKNEFNKIKEKIGPSYKSATPTYVFEVQYSHESEERFERIRASRRLLHAYHGSRLENFHSILHHGLSGTLNKTALFGEGTYLSSELSLCLDYSPFGHSWDCSVLGQKMSCVAVCQMIDCEYVKCQAEKIDNGELNGNSINGHNNNHNKNNKKDLRSRIKGSIGGDIPEKYYIVTNDEVIRLKYLLVYASRDKYHKSKDTPWYFRHGFMLILLSYLLILISIGLYKSPYLKMLLKYTSNTN